MTEIAINATVVQKNHLEQCVYDFRPCDGI